MKKVILIALGASVIVGCNSVPEKPMAAAAVNQSEPVAAAVAAPAVVVPEVVSQVAVAEPVVQVAPASVKAVAVVVESKPQTSTHSMPVMKTQAPKMSPQMAQIHKLINTSSGARQVIASDNPEAHKYHDQAKALYDQAEATEDQAASSQLLSKASMAMFRAIRSASPESVMAEKHQTDYHKLKRSVDAFKEQHERISGEKGAGSEGSALRAQVNTVVAEADKAFAAKQYSKAQLLLRESFEMLRNSIESMREGETLVRSLDFATKKDEYDYEFERYQSQLLLVDVLLKDKRASSAYVAKQVDNYIVVAEEARGKAEKAASDGDHEAGIEFLEAARKQIVRALRTGGIYVPG